MTLPDRYRIAPKLAGACALGMALALSVHDFAEARSALSERPPLPAMGPSLRKAVAFRTAEQPGTIVIRKDEKALYLVTRQGQALRYQISVGRDGFGWTGIVKV
ncbi:L,D-transpeptidase, partial [Mesorhizobium sp. M7A.F.Ca.CA.004.05.1.1]